MTNTTRRAGIRVAKGTTIVKQRRFYSPTFLRSDNGRSTLFVFDAALVRTKGGRFRSSPPPLTLAAK